jgi:hypothetical protein
VAYVKIILALLQIIEAILDWSKEKRLKQEGADEEIARATARILQKTTFAKKTLGEANGMSESAILDFLRGFEPEGDGQLLPNVPATHPKQG